MNWLLDTNIVSEVRKKARADPGVVAFFDRCEPDSLFLSVLTVGELRKGIEKLRRRDPRAASSLDAWLSSVLDLYRGRILDVDHRVAEIWGEMSAAASLPVIDSLIAATARVHRLTLVTRNVRDFARSGVEVLDPFTG